MIQIIPQMRGRDPQGAGYHGASRGNRKHNGVDFVASVGDYVQLSPGDPVKAMNAGTVTKLGYPYAHDLSFRYVQVTDDNGIDCRYFYIEPCVDDGQRIAIGDVLGTLQELPYEGITQHYHVECKRATGQFVDPIRYLSGDIK